MPQKKYRRQNLKLFSPPRGGVIIIGVALDGDYQLYITLH